MISLTIQLMEHKIKFEFLVATNLQTGVSKLNEHFNVTTFVHALVVTPPIPRQ